MIDADGKRSTARVTQTTQHFVTLDGFGGLKFHRTTGKAKGNQNLRFVPRVARATHQAPEVVQESATEDVVTLMEIMGVLSRHLHSKPELAQEVASALCKIIERKTKEGL